MKKSYFDPADNEERELMQSLDAGEWVPAKNKSKMTSMVQEAALDYQIKNKNINIRITNGDVGIIKSKAAAAGLPYQTLISSILHQYATGKIKIEL